MQGSRFIIDIGFLGGRHVMKIVAFCRTAVAEPDKRIEI